jgi:quercetin dioxygenase-like cupin family protein
MVWFTDRSGGGPFSLASVHFAPGARTAWHNHPKGQTLYVTEGVALVQDRGGPAEEVPAGQTVVTEAGVWHWHGAAPRQFMTHLAVYEGAPEWGDLVSDGEYLAGAEG